MSHVAQAERSISDRITAHHMYRQGSTKETIAGYLGISKRCVTRYLGEPCPQPPPPTEVPLRSFYMEGACGKHPELNWGSRVFLMQAKAKEVCRRCPVLAKCRTYGLTNGRDNDGVWGAMTTKERQREIRRRQCAESRPDRGDIAGVA